MSPSMCIVQQVMQQQCGIEDSLKWKTVDLPLTLFGGRI